MKKRAIRDDDKRERRATILNAAGHLFEEKGFANMSMTELAQSLSLAKGTLYLYFPTKESIFLALEAEALESWFEDFGEHLRNLAQPRAEAVARLVCESLARHQRLPRLLVLLHSVLEHNVSIEEVKDFKRLLLGHLSRTASVLEKGMPHLKSGEGLAFLIRLHALVIGFWQMADLSPAVQAAVEEDDLALFRLRFEPLLEGTLIRLLS